MCTGLPKLICNLKFGTNHVSSLKHHFPSLGFPNSWYCDHPVKVWCFEVLVAKISHFCEQSVLQMVKKVCNNIHQEELLAIQCSDFLVPVNILGEEKWHTSLQALDQSARGKLHFRCPCYPREYKFRPLYFFVLQCQWLKSGGSVWRKLLPKPVFSPLFILLIMVVACKFTCCVCATLHRASSLSCGLRRRCSSRRQ